MIEKLENYISKPLISFEEIFNKDTKLFSFDIDCSSLPEADFTTDKIDYVPQLVKIIEILNTLHKPCLYWFEATSNNEAIIINSLLDEFRLNENLKDRRLRRVVPAKNNYHNSNSTEKSKVIYVGKRHEGMRKRDKLTNISGRIAIHFGYYKNGSTQGLQLSHWAKNSRVNLKLNVLELPIESKEYLELLEKLLAKKLKPLCGRH